MSPSKVFNDLSLHQAIAAGVSGSVLKHPQIETTGRGHLTLEGNGPIQMGFWVPNRIFATGKYLAALREELKTIRGSEPLIPLTDAVANFKTWVTTHSIQRMWLNSMIQQANAFVSTLAPETQQEIENKCGVTLYISGYDEFFEVLSVIVQTSPSFNDTAQSGTPMSGFLSVGMGTEAGAALFHDSEFNGQLKLVLNSWNEFLKSSNSLSKLDINDPEKPGSWISKAAHAAGVWEQMQYDANAPGYGFDSWNSFFIRQFAAGTRPFHGDEREVVNLGCETIPWAYVSPAQYEEDFWVKDVAYSLLDLFGGRTEIADKFKGGQVYQGYLSAACYHRWQSPVTGELVSSWVQPGTYYAQRASQGENMATWEGMVSQPYLGHVATRAIFLFKHPGCGYVAMICIGMVEVSTCVIEPDWVVGESDDPKEIERSTEIGHFEYGGSTHILVFEKDKVQLVDWAIDASAHQNDPRPVPMGSVIAKAVSHGNSHRG